MYFLVKTLFSALIIATVTQFAEKMPVGSAMIKSLPIASLMVFFIMKYEGRTNQEIMSMSWDILYMVIPSLVLFVVFPLLLSRGLNFYISLLLATLVMSIGYAITFKVLA